LVNPAKPQRAAAPQAVIARPAFSIRLIAERGSTTAQVLQELYGQNQPHGAYFRWGLNE
jgi:hypothetical protein